jgi:hypothetical protein
MSVYRLCDVDNARLLWRQTYPSKIAQETSATGAKMELVRVVLLDQDPGEETWVHIERKRDGGARGVGEH